MKIKKVFIKLLHSNQIFIQLMVFALLISIIPILIISCFLASKMEGLVEREINKSHTQVVQQYVSNINKTFIRHQDSLMKLANSTIIIDYLLNTDQTANAYIKGKIISEEVDKYLLIEGHSEFYNCMVYTYNNNSPVYGRSVSAQEIAQKETWYDDVLWKDGESFAYNVRRHKNKILSLMKEITYVDTLSFKKEQIGMIKLDLDTKCLFEPVSRQEEESYPYDVVVLDRYNNQVYASDRSLANQIMKINLEHLGAIQPFAYGTHMLYSEDIETYDLKVIVIFENTLFIKQLEEVKHAVIPLIMIFIGIVLVITYGYTRSFSKRVQGLVGKIKAVEEGDFSIKEEIGGNDEIAILDSHFNIMIKQVDMLIKRNYIQQLEKKEAELRNLQLQINPHFLYNTLETISAMAAVEGMFSICDLCEKLGEIFRYSLGRNYGEYVTIGQEIQHTKNYIFIQHTRFREKFQVFYEIDPISMEYQILRFILQPIVENAISHGLSKGKCSGKLVIAIKQNANQVCIEIKDNGVGMTEEKLCELKQYLEEEEMNFKGGKRSIGIKNVHERIKLCYGKEYGISVESKLGEGSTFTITVPLR